MEYVLLVSLISTATISSITFLGSNVSNTMNSAAEPIAMVNAAKNAGGGSSGIPPNAIPGGGTSGVQD